MRISKEQAAQNRERVVEAASALFRERGFDGVAVADLMRAAGFTHGGFYNHFPTKEALATESLTRAFDDMAAVRAKSADMAEMLSGYLSNAARRAPGKTCPAAALAGDVARQPAPVRTAFADGVDAMIESFAAQIGGPGARERATALLAKMVGGLMLARGVPDDHPLADALLTATLASCLDDVA
ncbi:TetR/AcrR family transcriptional regulator [Phenylobacterium sp.]|uniref:TetR/AcrR family transcriptional regulator n=1 Tax=Phenylobacterium sp. TaxID=1871053 RepID=UPI002EDB2195